MVRLADLLSPNGPEGRETLRVSLADRLRVATGQTQPPRPTKAKTGSTAPAPQPRKPLTTQAPFQPDPATDLFPPTVDEYSVVTGLFPKKGYGIIEQFRGGESAHFELDRNPRIDVGMVVRYARYVDEGYTIWAYQLRTVGGLEIYRRHAHVAGYTPLYTQGFLIDPFLSKQIDFSAQPEMRARFPVGSWAQFWLMQRGETFYALDLQPGHQRDAALYSAPVVSKSVPFFLLGSPEEPIRLEQRILEAAGRTSVSVGEAVSFRMEVRTDGQRYAWQVVSNQ